MSLLVAVGLLVAALVGFNIGGSSTGVAFGPAVGSRLVRKATAAALFSAVAFLGAWAVGPNVIVTMSEGIVPAAQFTPEAGVGVLFFTGSAARGARSTGTIVANGARFLAKSRTVRLTRGALARDLPGAVRCGPLNTEDDLGGSPPDVSR